MAVTHSSSVFFVLDCGAFTPVYMQEAEAKRKATSGDGDPAGEEAARREYWQDAMQQGLLTVEGLEFDKRWIRLLRVVKTQVSLASAVDESDYKQVIADEKCLFFSPGQFRAHEQEVGSVRSGCVLRPRFSIRSDLCAFLSPSSLVAY